MINVTVSCDTCGDVEDVELSSRHGGIDLPDEWIEDPDDDDEHMCKQCQIDEGLLPEPEYEVYMPPVLRTRTGFNAMCTCGALVWHKTQPCGQVTCNVCKYLAPPKLLGASCTHS